MSQIQVYDKPMCCSTGVCGPEVDPVLPRFAADLQWLAEQGHHVERFNLAQQPEAFVGHPQVQQTLMAEGASCLPLILVDGQIVSRQGYPTRDELAAWATGNAGLAVLPVMKSGGSCCGGESCC